METKQSGSGALCKSGKGIREVVVVARQLRTRQILFPQLVKGLGDEHLRQKRREAAGLPGSGAIFPAGGGIRGNGGGWPAC